MNSIASSTIDINKNQYLFGPPEQILYFDFSRPNRYILNATWTTNKMNFVLVNYKMNVYQAMRYCMKKYGSSLASIHNHAQNAEARELCLAGSASQDCFIGLHHGISKKWQME